MRPDAPAAAAQSHRWRLSRAQIALALAGGLSILPPYLGPAVGLELDVRGSVEVVDHVLPGAVVALCGALTALRFRWRMDQARAGVWSLVLYSTAFLAGLFQTATHVPLAFDGGQPLTPWGAVLLHATLAPVITAIALWLLANSLAAAFPDSADPDKAEGRRQRR